MVSCCKCSFFQHSPKVYCHFSHLQCPLKHRRRVKNQLNLPVEPMNASTWVRDATGGSIAWMASQMRSVVCLHVMSTSFHAEMDWPASPTRSSVTTPQTVMMSRTNLWNSAVSAYSRSLRSHIMCGFKSSKCSLEEDYQKVSNAWSTKCDELDHKWIKLLGVHWQRQ